MVGQSRNYLAEEEVWGKEGCPILDMLSRKYLRQARKDSSEVLVRHKIGELDLGDINLWVTTQILKADVLAKGRC
jgi:hypothetical protein